MLKKLLTLTIVFLLSLCVLSGCGGNNYDATLYSKANEWVDDEFLKENRVKAYYPNENYVEGESDISEKYIHDTTSPSSRVFIITDEEEFNRILSKSQLDIDFQKQTVILYIFSDVNSNRKYNLKSIELNDKILTVKTELEYKNCDDATMPFQRCFLLTMNKVEINETIFE